MTENNVEKAEKAAIPLKMKRDTSYSIRVWTEWASQRCDRFTSEDIPNIAATMYGWCASTKVDVLVCLRDQEKEQTALSSWEHLSHHMWHFMLFEKFWKASWLLQRQGIHWFSENAEMKRLKSAGIHSKECKGKPLTTKEKEKLLQKVF